MNGKLAWRIAGRQLQAQRHLNVPFILASSLMFALDYIILSLLMNQYVIDRHPNLILIIRLGVVICTLLTGVFVLYANNFYQKQRFEEMALYSILGLEKRHIRSILRKEKVVQTVLMLLLSLCGGHLFGAMVFLGLNKLMQDTGTTLMAYPFRWQIAVGLSIIVLVIMGLATLKNSRQVTRLNAMELLREQGAGEREPKSRWIVTILGIALVAGGYYLALSNAQNVLSALSNILLAILLVVLGTYALYLGLAIIFLKALKHNKRYYYQPRHFFSISGMLFRMKANAVSLASIAVLSTGILLTAGLTVSLYRGMQTQVDSVMAQDYTITSEQGTRDALEDTLAALHQHVQTKDAAITASVTAAAYLKDHQLLPLDPKLAQTDKEILDHAFYMMVEGIDDFNQKHGEHIQLAADEVLMTATTHSLADQQTLKINGKTYRVRAIDQRYLSSQLAVDYLFIVLPEQVALNDIGNYYYQFNPQTKEKTAAPLQYQLQFNVMGNDAWLKNNAAAFAEAHQVEISNRQEAVQLLYELNGGLLFLGVVVSVVLMVGVGLMLYYKQISEGMEDRENFRMMAQMGLPNTLIQQTIRQQILTLFLLPLFTALIHIGVGFTILRALLRLLAVRDIGLVLSSFGWVTLVFAVVYGLFFLLTQRTYYHIIHPQSLATQAE